MRKLAFRLVFPLYLFFFTGIVNAQPPLNLSTFAGPPLSTIDRRGFYDLVLTEAFNRSGISINISHLPAERSLTNADAGITDGDFVRINGLEQLYPNLIQIPEKIADFEFVAFTKKSEIQIKNWEDCKAYNVAIVKGWKILETNLAGSYSLKKIKNQKLLFTMLANNRTDIVVYSRFEGYEMIKQLNLKNILVIEPPLATREMFLYLNKKHHKIVSGIVENLRNMKQDGTFKRIADEVLNPYFEGTHND
jgi:polar amino acid transport system substrate-binding protein